MKTVKMGKIAGTVKKFDWHLLVRELLDGLFLSQQDLAERCKVSQQSISNWKNGIRHPSSRAKQKIYEFSQKEGIDLSKYEAVSARDKIKKYLEKDNGKELVRIFELYLKMSRKAKAKFLGSVRIFV